MNRKLKLVYDLIEAAYAAGHNDAKDEDGLDDVDEIIVDHEDVAEAINALCEALDIPPP